MELEKFLNDIGFGSAIEKLVENGIESVKALESCSLDDLKSVLPHLAANAIIRKIQSQGQQNANNQLTCHNQQNDQESSVGREIVAKEMEIIHLKLELAENDKKHELMKKDLEHQLDIKNKEIEMLNMKIDHSQIEGDLKVKIVEAEMNGKISVMETKLEESKKTPSVSENCPPWWNVSLYGPWNNQNGHIPFYPPNTVLLTPPFYVVISSWLGAPRQWTLRYRASRDGMSVNTFHSFCNGVGPTITIIRSSNGYLFGGFNSQSWTSDGCFQSGTGSFIFTLTNPHGTAPTVFHNRSTSHGGRGVALYGPTFGSGYDFYVYSNNICNFGFPLSYKDTLGYGSNTFTGTNTSTISDYEVFSV